MNIECIIEELNYYANVVAIANDEQTEAPNMVEESRYIFRHPATDSGILLQI